MAVANARLWGDWYLGDLADAARDAADLLGPSQDVQSLTIARPGSNGVPRVLVLVNDESGLFRLRNEVRNGEFIARFMGEQQLGGWAAEVAGMELHVQIGGVES